MSTTGVFWTEPVYVNRVLGASGKYLLSIVVGLWKFPALNAGH